MENENAKSPVRATGLFFRAERSVRQFVQGSKWVQTRVLSLNLTKYKESCDSFGVSKIAAGYPARLVSMGKSNQACRRKNRTEAGREGEEEAASELENRGWKLIERNFRTRRGEVDIIALRGDTLAFFEVKTWKCYSKEELSASIGAKKRSKIIETSKIFLAKHRQYYDNRIRYDILFLDGDFSMTHYEGAFVE